jgi:hypothetical protein
MDNPSTLRRRAARYFANAASSTTPEEAERLKETGRQLELWADEFEEKPTSPSDRIRTGVAAVRERFRDHFR